jgi:hypothetical protein
MLNPMIQMSAWLLPAGCIIIGGLYSFILLAWAYIR